MLKTIVFAPLGPFRKELLAFVRSIPVLELIGVAAEPGEVLVCLQQMVPTLLIVVGTARFISVIKTLTCAGVHTPLFCLVSAENQQQIRQALDAGADAVLLQGFSTQEFLFIINQITETNL